MTDRVEPGYRFHRDWRQWCYPGPRRVFTAEELARGGNQPWPVGVDQYVVINTLILLTVNPAAKSVVEVAVSVVLGLLVAAISLRVARWLWRQPTRWRLNLASYGAGLGFGLATAFAVKLGAKEALRDYLHIVVMLIVGILMAWWMLTLYRVQQIESRLRELDEQAAREQLAARLGAAQIQPHFLFNTLASLQHWVETGDARAAPLLRDFSAYLRATLPMFERELQPLADELGMVRSYLAIMQARLGERLSFNIDADPQLAVQLPPGTLLTLVENAIRHGIEPQLHGGHIEIKAQSVGQLAVLSVRDDGAGLSPQAQDGVGLSNTRRRLQQAFGDAASLALTDAQPGCLATLKLPL